MNATETAEKFITPIVDNYTPKKIRKNANRSKLRVSVFLVSPNGWEEIQAMFWYISEAWEYCKRMQETYKFNEEGWRFEIRNTK